MEDPLALMVTGYGHPYYHDPKPRRWKAEEHESMMRLGPDAFHVDDLLEFSNEIIGGPIGGVEGSAQSVESSLTFAETTSQQSVATSKQPSSKPSDEEQHAKDLGLDYNEIAELDWLSNFVEESYSTMEHMDFMSKELLSIATEKHPESRTPSHHTFATSSSHTISESSTTSARETSLSSKAPVPGRARSKRCSRSGNRVWSSSILGSGSQTLVEAHPSMLDMPMPICAESFLFYDYSDLSADSKFILTPEGGSTIPPVRKYFKPCKAKKLGQNGSSPRRCTHCLSQHTPQWRAGPAGPKTLCNACGVRYKSGRLLPEYRPASSPTFIAHAHSNSHRKVLEMRKQKEVQTPIETSTILTRREAALFNTKSELMDL